MGRPRRQIVVYHTHNRRSRALGRAFADGCRKLGEQVIERRANTGQEPIEGAIGVCYGLQEPLGTLRRRYLSAGHHFVTLDLGYWCRVLPYDKLGGYHRVSVDALHPVHFDRRPHPEDRAHSLGLRVSPRQVGEEILLAGMSGKAAGVYGLQVEAFERQALKRVKKLTKRPVCYRPKPSAPGREPLPGALYSPPQEPLEAALRRAAVVVAHHSNVAVDGLLAGVPCIVDAPCVASPLANSWEALRDGAELYLPSEEKRWRWACDVAYTQWTPAEMASGALWRHLQEEGLL